jgi:hypothetical protein
VVLARDQSNRSTFAKSWLDYTTDAGDGANKNARPRSKQGTSGLAQAKTWRILQPPRFIAKRLGLRSSSAFPWTLLSRRVAVSLCSLARLARLGLTFFHPD